MERSAPQTYRIAVLTSGHSRGSNLRALHSYFQEHSLPVQIAFVVATDPTAPVVSWCAENCINCNLLAINNKTQFETQLLTLCSAADIDLIALAGFLKLLTGDFLHAVKVPVLNIHPALLPKYGGKGMYGLRVHEAVLAAGDRYSGATIHRVDAIYDHGEIVAQQETDISGCQSAGEIAARVLQIEHQIYAPAIYAYLTKQTK